MKNPISRKCSKGCEKWPDSIEYLDCPACEHSTRRIAGVTPLPEDEAEVLKKQYEFERFYIEEWPDQRASHLPSVC